MHSSNCVGVIVCYIHIFICIHMLLHLFGVSCECGVVSALPLHAFVPLAFELVN